jgi:hypothetical protein
MTRKNPTPEENARREKCASCCKWQTSTDNLAGFSAAIEAVFPKTEIQNCIIHQLRNSSNYVSYKDLKALMADLKAAYAAVDEAASLATLGTFSEHWHKKCPKISQSWRENWSCISMTGCQADRCCTGLTPPPLTRLPTAGIYWAGVWFRREGISESGGCSGCTAEWWRRRRSPLYGRVRPTLQAGRRICAIIAALPRRIPAPPCSCAPS